MSRRSSRAAQPTPSHPIGVTDQGAEATQPPSALPFANPFVAVALCIGAALIAAAAAMRDETFLLIAAVATISVALVALRSLEAFIATIILVRPMLDVFAAEQSSSGVSLTELFGVGITLALAIWLSTSMRALRDYFNDFSVFHLSTLGLLLAVTVSTVGTERLEPSVTFLARVATGAVLFFSVDLALRRGLIRPRVLAMAILGSAVVPLLYPLLGPLGVQTHHVKDGVLALKSVFHLSNNFAYFLVPFILLSIAMAARTRGRVRGAWALVLAVCLVELVKTETRGAWIGVAAGVLVLALVLERRILVVGGIVGLLGFAFSSQLRDRILNLIPDPSAPRTVDSLSWRLDQWAKLLPQVRDSPITGIGPDGAWVMTGKEPHNEYVRFFVETGIVGGLLFLAFVGSLVYVGWRVWYTGRLTDPPLVVAAKAAYFAFAVACAVSFFGENLIDAITFMSILLPTTALALHAERWEVGDHQIRYRRRTYRDAPEGVPAGSA